MPWTGPALPFTLAFVINKKKSSVTCYRSVNSDGDVTYDVARS